MPNDKVQNSNECQMKKINEQCQFFELWILTFGIPLGFWHLKFPNEISVP
jgi:hypothetical protein